MRIRKGKSQRKLFGAAAALSVFAACMLLLFGQDISAAQDGLSSYTKIYTYEDLLAMAEDPAGDYVLMQDIDLAGYEWEPIDFRGRFDGNGHALLNVSVTQTGGAAAETYDGNMKVYDTVFAGFFGTLSGAGISNLTLLNYKAEITADNPCFVGSIAGYCDRSSITDCRIEAYIELNAHDRMFGVGGIVGYGNGQIKNTNADVTLVCTDTDSATKDEQFLGGAYGAGYMDLDGCRIVIDGYISEHGYVHSGGVGGMYMLYPAETVYAGWLTNTRVEGKITFYEDNADRRAYCGEFIGEVLDWTYEVGGNSADFLRDEQYDYSVTLKPHMCGQPEYSAAIANSSCEDYGYTLYRCNNCGYEYRDQYTLLEHAVSEWTETEEDIYRGTCGSCGAVLEKKEERKEYTPDSQGEGNGIGRKNRLKNLLESIIRRIFPLFGRLKR